MTTTERKRYNKKYYQVNKDKLHAQRRKRYKKDPLIRLKEVLAVKVRGGMLSGYPAESLLRNIIGLGWLDFRKHISDQFTKEMSWSNRGKWHLDHIIPTSSATTEKELIDLFNYKNYRPLLVKDNQTKGNRI